MTVPRFWREIPQRYNLQASRCSVCAATYFPPREVCPACRRASIGKMEGMRLAGVGSVVEWTRVHKPAPGYELQVPYVIALIQTPEGPLVTGQIVDLDGALPETGTPVRSVFRRIGQDGDSGVIHYGTKWVLAAKDGPVSPEGETASSKKAKTPPPKRGRLGSRGDQGDGSAGKAEAADPKQSKAETPVRRGWRKPRVHSP